MPHEFINGDSTGKRHMGVSSVSKSNGTPKSSIFIGLSIINHPFWGSPIFGNTDIVGHVEYCMRVLHVMGPFHPKSCLFFSSFTWTTMGKVLKIQHSRTYMYDLICVCIVYFLTYSMHWQWMEHVATLHGIPFFLMLSVFSMYELAWIPLVSWERFNHEILRSRTFKRFCCRFSGWHKPPHHQVLLCFCSVHIAKLIYSNMVGIALT